MRSIGHAAAVAALLACGACARGGGNDAGNQANVVAEEGIEDLNAAISGDELTPDAEAADDMAANRSNVVVPVNATMPANAAR